tara:strand:- start:328 stop:1446 length:1119 start_codon:yes stop_codon:yes gene_type:complete
MIRFNDIRPQWKAVRGKLDRSLARVFEDSEYILGPEVSSFEDKFANWNRSKFALGVSNGLDGLSVAAQALNLDNPVVIYVPENTFIATVLGVYRAIPLATFVSVPISTDYLMDLDALVDLVNQHSGHEKTTLIVPVHLYGKAVDVNRILMLKKELSECYIIEDCSQAHGAFYPNTTIPVGNFGDINVFSLYPGKNLGGIGDGGIITCGEKSYYQKMRAIRNIGMYRKYQHEEFGGNYRLDSVNAHVLSAKLPHMKAWTESRQKIAKKYDSGIQNPSIVKPMINRFEEHAFHIYCIRVQKRDSCIKFLDQHGIETVIHYPHPWMTSPCLKDTKIITTKSDLNYFNDILSIPMHPFLTDSEVSQIIDVLNRYEG